jgi:hypothetical protein
MAVNKKTDALCAICSAEVKKTKTGAAPEHYASWYAESVGKICPGAGQKVAKRHKCPTHKKSPRGCCPYCLGQWT